MGSIGIPKIVLRAWRRFAAAKDGGVVFTMGIMLMPVMMMVGATLDYGRLASTRTTLQGAVDGAAIAAAAAVVRGEDPAPIAEAFVLQRISGSRTTDPRIVTRSFPGYVHVSASFRIPTTFMRVADINTMIVAADARAAVGAGGQPLEVAIVLDTTESMALPGRLDAAKAAAKRLIDIVTTLPDGARNRNVRVGLVPFAKYVNIGTRYHTESWLSSQHPWLRDSLTYRNPTQRCNNCRVITIPETPKTCYRNDFTPYSCPKPPYEQCADCPNPTPIDDPVYWAGCVGSRGDNDETPELSAARPAGPIILFENNEEHDTRCPKPLMRLTTDVERLDQAIDDLSPEGETYIAPGLLWGWRLLSPGLPFADGSSNPYVRKFIVLMTDGTNTHSPGYAERSSPWHESTDVPFANQKLRTICTNVKNADIRLYTVAFKVDNPTINDILSTCASSPLHYFKAVTNDELREAFGTIGAQLTALRLLR